MTEWKTGPHCGNTMHRFRDLAVIEYHGSGEWEFQHPMVTLNDDDELCWWSVLDGVADPREWARQKCIEVLKDEVRKLEGRE